MSACMRSLYSSDQRAPGLSLRLLCGRGVGAGTVLVSVGGFRAPGFSLRVARGGVLEEKLELFMRLLGTYFGLVRGSSWRRTGSRRDSRQWL